MGEQQSQKRGLRSAAQKEDATRDAYAPLPATTDVGGAFGKRERGTPSDRDLSLSTSEKHAKQAKHEKERS